MLFGALDASVDGGGVDISSNEDDEVDSILMIGSFVLLLLLLLGRGDSICGDIWPLLLGPEPGGINELVNGRPERVKPVRSLEKKQKNFELFNAWPVLNNKKVKFYRNQVK